MREPLHGGSGPIGHAAPALIILFCRCRGTRPATFDTTLQQGIAAYREGKFADAVQSFRQAVHLNERSAEAHMYLGTAYMSQWIPGAQSPENQSLADQARHEFEQVIEYEPWNANAYSPLAFLAYNEATAESNHQARADV